MRILNLSLALCLASCAAAAQELTWTELANRPELWPAQCTVNVAIKFEGGVSVQPGEKAEVRDFKGNEVNLRTTDGKTYFAAETDESSAHICCTCRRATNVARIAADLRRGSARIRCASARCGTALGRCAARGTILIANRDHTRTAGSGQ